MPNKLITAKLCPVGSAAPDIFGFVAEVYSPTLVALDQIEGWHRARVDGQNPDIDQGDLPEDIWWGGGTYPWKAAAGPLEVLSDSPSDTGAQVVLTLLSASYYAHDVTVTLGAGPTSIPGGPWLRINGGYVSVPAVGQGTNVGNISVQDAGAGTVRGIMPAGRGSISGTNFTVPSKRTFVLWAGISGAADAETRQLAYDVRVWSKTLGGAEQLGYPFGIQGRTNPYRLELVIPTAIPEKTDLVLRVTAASHNSVAAAGMLYGVLVHNSALSELVPYPGELGE
jgi:hypothetical protein